MLTFKAFARFTAVASLASLLAFAAIMPQQAWAQSDDPVTTPLLEQGAHIAARLGVTEEELQTAIVEVAEQITTAAVEQELIDETEAEALVESASTLVEDGWQGPDSGLRELAMLAEQTDLDVTDALATALDLAEEDVAAAFGAVGPQGRGQGVGPMGDDFGAGQPYAQGRGEFGPMMDSEDRAALQEAHQALLAYLDGETMRGATTDEIAAAIETALAEGTITQEQADLLNAMPQRMMGRAGGGHMGGGHMGGGHMGGGHMGRGQQQRGDCPMVESADESEE